MSFLISSHVLFWLQLLHRLAILFEILEAALLVFVINCNNFHHTIVASMEDYNCEEKIFFYYMIVYLVRMADLPAEIFLLH